MDACSILPKFSKCCFCINLQFGVIVLSIIMIFDHALKLGFLSYQLLDGLSDPSALIVFLSIETVAFVCQLLLLLGIASRNWKLFLPCLYVNAFFAFVLQSVWIIYFIVIRGLTALIALPSYGKS